MNILDGESMSEVESGVILQFDATENEEQAQAKLDLAKKLKYFFLDILKAVTYRVALC